MADEVGKARRIMKHNAIRINPEEEEEEPLMLCDALLCPVAGRCGGDGRKLRMKELCVNSERIDPQVCY